MAATGQISEHLAPGLREIVGTRLGGRESYYSQLLRVETSERQFEEYLAGAGMPIAVLKPEGEDIQSFDPLEGNKLRVDHSTSALGLEITEEAMDYDLYKGQGSILTEAGNGLADGLAEYVEIQAHRFFNSEAFLTSAVPSFMRVLPDNASTVSIYSTLHNPVAGGEVGVQANRPATNVDFTVTSYRAARTAFRRYKNDRALRIPGITMPNRLVIPPELEYDAMEIINNPTRPDSGNDIKNVTRGTVQIIVDPYLDDTDAWFLMSPLHWLIFLWSKRPYMDSFDDRRKRISIHVALQRFSQIAVHWLGTYASQGA